MTISEAGQARSPQAAREAWGLAGLLAVAAALRAFAWHQTAVIFNDGPVFLEMAQAIAAGRWEAVFAHPYHPLYPGLIALVALAPIELESAAVTVSIFGGLLSILGIFLFVRRAFGRDLAWLAAWTVALHPWAVDFSSDVMSDGLYAGLYLLGFAALASLIEKPRLPVAAACGIATGLAYLTRPEGVGLLICGLVLFGVRGFLVPEQRVRSRAALVALVAVTGLVMAPLLLSLSEQAGEFSLTRKKSLTALATGTPPSVVEATKPTTEATMEAIPQPILLPRSSERADGGGAVKPARTLAGFLEACSRAGRTSLAALRYEIALMVVVGAFVLRGRALPLREWTVAVPVVLYSGVLVLLVWGAGYVARRHALAALLPLVAYAAVGWRAMHGAVVERVGRARPEWAGRLAHPRVLSLGLVLVLCVAWGARDLRPRRVDRLAVRAAAEWLAQQGVVDAPVAVQKLRVAYYARGRYVPLPSGNDGPIEGTLRGLGVRWVVLDETGLQDHRGLEEGVGNWLRSVHSVERAGQRALVLEMTPKPAH